MIEKPAIPTKAAAGGKKRHFPAWFRRSLPLPMVLTGLHLAFGASILCSKEERSEERQRMVQHQLSSPGRNIQDPLVLQAMAKVPRHLLVPPEQRSYAYADRPLPIGYQQTISQPFIVAFMTEQLGVKPTDRVLEIGTGSGYQAAILAELVDQVYTIEIVEPLAERAGKDLASLGYENIHVRAGDGFLGWPEAAPFDAMIVTCAPERIPEPLIEQLKEGGRMMIPVGGENQELYLLTKKDGKIVQQAILPVRFVPMTGQVQEVP